MHDFSFSRDPIFSDSKGPVMIVSDSRNLIFNSRDPNRVPETPYKNPELEYYFYSWCGLLALNFKAEVFTT